MYVGPPRLGKNHDYFVGALLSYHTENGVEGMIGCVNSYDADMTGWPDIRELELLVQIEEQGGISAAARHLRMAQPNASRAISGLESQLGLALVRRTPRGAELTLAGAQVADRARAVLSTTELLLAGVSTMKNQNSAKISVAASMTIADHLIPHWLGSFSASHSEVKVTFAVQNSQDVFSGVRSGAFDIGFVESPEESVGLSESIVGHDRMTVVVAPNHPWTRRRTALSIEELANTPLVVREEGSGTRVTLDNFLAPYKPVDPLMELQSNAAVRIGVRTGIGPAVLSYLAVQEALRADELVAIPVTGMNLVRTLRAVWDGSQRITGVRRELVEIATSLSVTD